VAFEKFVEIREFKKTVRIRKIRTSNYAFNRRADVFLPHPVSTETPTTGIGYCELYALPHPGAAET